MTQASAQVWLLSYYRAAELRGADLLGRLLRKTDDPHLHINLTRHFADEARHAWLWTRRIQELGAAPLPVVDGYQRRLRQYVGLPSSVLELLALTHVAEERVQQRYREHAARPGEDPRTVAVLQIITADEEWHLAWIETWLAGQAREYGSGQIVALLDRYRALEAKAYAELASEEERFGITLRSSSERPRP
jgi:bacterioferritin (cytochrome b1)